MSHRRETNVFIAYLQRRTRQPYGMESGGSGSLGRNTWIKKLRSEDRDMYEENDIGTRNINIGGKATVFMGKGDRFLVETPGGGAWGAPDSQRREKRENPHACAWEPRGSFAEREAAQAAF